MAVVPRSTKKGIVYYVVTRGKGERVGFDQREAERLDARRKRELKAGTYAPIRSGGMAVGTYLREWMDSRTNRGAITDKSLVRNHALDCEWLCSMRMDDVGPRHAKKFALELQKKISSKTGKPLADKYIYNINGALKTAFAGALLDEVISRDVWKLPHAFLSKISEEIEPYSREEATAMLAAASAGRLIWLALAFYTGMRCGEVCGRRWRHWDRASRPLGCLTIDSQYNDKPLKGDGKSKIRPRKSPVHPELERILDEWWATGFEEVYCRKPSINDFIIPSRSDGIRNMQRSSSYKALVKDCVSASVQCRGQHATRHTFITNAQRDGAHEKIVEKITHNAKGAQIDQYTHRHWDELCEAVLLLRPYGRKLVSILDWDFPEAENMLENCSDSRTRTSETIREPRESGESTDLAGLIAALKSPAMRGMAADLAAGKEFDPVAWARAIAGQGGEFRSARRVIGSVLSKKAGRDVG